MVDNFRCPVFFFVIIDEQVKTVLSKLNYFDKRQKKEEENSCKFKFLLQTRVEFKN